MSDKWLEKPKSEAGNLSESDREMMRRFLASPSDFPPEFKAWLFDWVAQEVVPSIAGKQIQGRPQGAASKEASYVTMDHNNPLTGERRLVAGSGVRIVDGGADGDVTISAQPVFLPGDEPDDPEIPMLR